MKKPTTIFTLAPADALTLHTAISYASESEAFSSDDAALETLYHAVRPRERVRTRLRLTAAHILLLRQVVSHVSSMEAWHNDDGQLEKLYQRLQAAGSRVLSQAGDN